MDRTISVDGYVRTYAIYRPCTLRHSPPVVLMLHGRGMSKEQAAEQFGWLQLADQFQFIVVFPQALPVIPELNRGAPLPPTLPSWFGSRNDTLWWDSQYFRSFPNVHHPDDGIFLLQLISRVLADEKADPKSVFAAGFSNGGRMIADLAARGPSLIRAFASIGAIGAAIGALRPPSLTSPVTLLLFSGDADFTLMQESVWKQIPRDQKMQWFGEETLPTLSSEAGSWASLDGCATSKTEGVPWGKRIVWTGCRGQAHIEGYIVRDLGHEWPGGADRWNELHKIQPKLDLTSLIWRFFVDSAKP